MTLGITGLNPARQLSLPASGHPRQADVFRCVRQHSQVPRSLECRCQPALVLRARARLAARLDACAIREEPAQPHRVLVVDRFYLVSTEHADTAAPEVPATRTFVAVGGVSSRRPVAEGTIGRRAVAWWTVAYRCTCGGDFDSRLTLGYRRFCNQLSIAFYCCVSSRLGVARHRCFSNRFRRWRRSRIGSRSTLLLVLVCCHVFTSTYSGG